MSDAQIDNDTPTPTRAMVAQQLRKDVQLKAAAFVGYMLGFLLSSMLMIGAVLGMPMHPAYALGLSFGAAGAALTGRAAIKVVEPFIGAIMAYRERINDVI